MTGYRLVRKNVKHITIYIRDGEAEVHAPKRADKADIDKAVAAKAKWIERKTAEARVVMAKKKAFTLTYGSVSLWRGREYRLLGDSSGQHIWRDDTGFHFPPGLDGSALKAGLIRLYHQSAKAHIQERAAFFAGRVGAGPFDVTITGAGRHWGSVSVKKTRNPAQKAGGGVTVSAPYRLHFSWRLIMAEDSLIDYVVVHELAHTKQMNHSEAFYAIVIKVLPDYTAREARLKRLSERLRLEDWTVPGSGR